MIQIRILLLSVLFISLACAHQQHSKALLYTENTSDNFLTSRFLYSDNESFFPITPTRIFQIILILLITGLANAGGIGGGPLLSPIFIIVLGYSESSAVEMVYALVFGGSLGNFINMIRKRDPVTEKPLINYDLNLICMPPMLLGVILGVTLNRIMAPLGIIVGLVGVASYSLPNVYLKAKKEFIKETKAIREKKELVASVDAETLKDSPTKKQKKSAVRQSASVNDSETGEELESPLEVLTKPSLFPKTQVGVIFILMIIIMVLAVFRGTQNFKSIVGVPYCGLAYWSIYGLAIFICFVALLIVMRFRTKTGSSSASFYQELDSDGTTIEVLGQSKLKLLLISFTAGILASTLGVGGGMIMSPTLLKMGMSPQAVAATSGFFVVQTTFVSLFQSCLYGEIPMEDRALMLITAIIGSYCISFCLSWLVRKHERPSIILYVLVFILALCLVATPICVLWRNFGDMGKILTFKSIC